MSASKKVSFFSRFRRHQWEKDLINVAKNTSKSLEQNLHMSALTSMKNNPNTTSLYNAIHLSRFTKPSELISSKTTWKFALEELEKASGTINLIEASKSTEIKPDEKSIFVEAENKSDQELKTQLRIRLYLASQYFQSMQSFIKNNNDETVKLVQKNIVSNRLVDSILFGSSSERIAEHLRLFPEECDEETLQAAFYVLYNAEVETSMYILKNIDNLQVKSSQEESSSAVSTGGVTTVASPTVFSPKSIKKATKIAQTFLLDQVELNTKNRCIFMWTGHDLFGIDKFPPPKEDHPKLTMPDLIEGRRKHFPEGSKISELFFEELQKEALTKEENRRESRQLMRRGVIFTVITTILDYIVSTM